MRFLRQAGLRYHGKAIASGAQTEHRGGAGPVLDLLGGGHAPAALISLMLRYYLSFLSKCVRSQTFTVVSWLAETRRLPSGVNATAELGAL